MGKIIYELDQNKYLPASTMLENLGERFLISKMSLSARGNQVS